MILFFHVNNTKRFADALEAAQDQDLRWRYTLLAATSLALEDAGDVSGAIARATAGFQHAEAYALREGKAVEVARGALNEVSAFRVRVRFRFFFVCLLFFCPVS